MRRNKKIPHDYKKRTREHIIADLSFNYVERIVLECGHYLDAVGKHDYGYDGQLVTCDDENVENGSVLLQLKSTDKPRYTQNRSNVSVSVTRADVNFWFGESFPVILVLWDSESKIAYWLHVQEYLLASPEFPLNVGRTSFTFHISTAHVVDQAAIEIFRRLKAAHLQQFRSNARYDN